MSCEPDTRTDRPFLQRLCIAATNLLIPLHTALLAIYFIARELSQGKLWFVRMTSYGLPWLLSPLILFLPAAMLRRSRPLILLSALPALAFLALYGELYLPKLPTEGNAPPVRVMAYNVFFGNQHAEAVAGEIERRDPDILGLHELEPPMAAALEERFQERYPYREINPGVGIFSRYPILQSEVLYFGWEGERLGVWGQQLLLDIDGQPVNLFNVHPRVPYMAGVHPFGLPLGLPTGFVTLGFEQDVQDLLRRMELTSGPTLVIGDLNFTDLEGEYAQLTEHLQDAHRRCGWGMGFTFSRFPSTKLALWRIDYVLYSSEFVCRKASTGNYGGSDHLPVMAELIWRAPNH